MKMTTFYHGFYTDLPDQFVEANSRALKAWTETWSDNPYLVRSRIIDCVSIDLVGDQKRDTWPTLKCASSRMLDLWMNSKGGNYNGRYWDSLAEDQRSPDRISRYAGGAGLTPLTSWTNFTNAIPTGSGKAVSASQLDAMMRRMRAYQNSLFGIPPSALMNWRDEWEGAKPPLKREGIIAGEIVGYRCWKIDRGLLRSVYQKDLWLPGQVLEGRELGDWDGRGIHAWKDGGSKHYHDYIRGYLNQEPDTLYSRWLRDDFNHAPRRPAMATGTVFLWGDVVEHERGWRAEFARVRSIDWLYPDETMMGREQAALDELRKRYGVASPSITSEGRNDEQ